MFCNSKIVSQFEENKTTINPCRTTQLNAPSPMPYLLLLMIHPIKPLPSPMPPVTHATPPVTYSHTSSDLTPESIDLLSSTTLFDDFSLSFQYAPNTKPPAYAEVQPNKQLSKIDFNLQLERGARKSTSLLKNQDYLK